MSAAPYRLGLTATYEREDVRQGLLPELVGGKVFELKPDDLAGKHLAKYAVNRIYVPLTEEERVVYEERAKVFREYVRIRAEIGGKTSRGSSWSRATIQGRTMLCERG